MFDLVSGATSSRKILVTTRRSAGRDWQWIRSVASAVGSNSSRTATGLGKTVALNSCSNVKFPNIHRMLTILGTLPVTTSESERVFSKLQRTLTSIRSTMTEDRLEALLLLQCHLEHCPTPDDVLCAFANTKARRLNFLLWSVTWI